MPYIPVEARRQLDGLIDELAVLIAAQAQESGYDGAFAGLLNYACTRLALKIVRKQFGQLRYWIIALLTGTFQNIADELYRRLAAPYENQQLARHGDVDLYREFLRDLETMV